MGRTANVESMHLVALVHDHAPCALAGDFVAGESANIECAHAKSPEAAHKVPNRANGGLCSRRTLKLSLWPSSRRRP